MESDLPGPWALNQSQRSSCLRDRAGRPFGAPGRNVSVAGWWRFTGKDVVLGRQCSVYGQERAGRGGQRGQFADPCSTFPSDHSHFWPVSKLHPNIQRAMAFWPNRSSLSLNHAACIFSVKPDASPRTVGRKPRRPRWGETGLRTPPTA